MRTPITPQQARQMNEEGKLQGGNIENASFGGNMNFEIRENETGKALFRERTNCDFNDKYRWVFVAKIVE